MLKTRILTVLILVPCVLAALFLLPPRAWGVAALLVAGAAAHEWARLVGLLRTSRWLFIGGVVLVGIALLFAPPFEFVRGWPDAVVLVVCGASGLFWLAAAPWWVVLRWPTTAPVPMAMVGWVVLVGAWMALVELQARSPWLLLAAMGLVWIADTAAYFAGRAFGRRKLAPQVSPGKTWEGVYGALLAVGVYAVALVPLARAAGLVLPIGTVVIATWLVFALLVAAISIIGDLFESLLKRQAGVKDSGALLPGHGGVLDRIDALLAAMPLVALAAQCFLAPP
jgi:phosphatidate cytidylyltransferase